MSILNTYFTIINNQFLMTIKYYKSHIDDVNFKKIWEICEATDVYNQFLNNPDDTTNEYIESVSNTIENNSSAKLAKIEEIVTNSVSNKEIDGAQELDNINNTPESSNSTSEQSTPANSSKTVVQDI